MLVKLPALWALSANLNTLGIIRQLILSESQTHCDIVPFSRENDRGHLLIGDDGKHVAYIFQHNPRPASFTHEDLVVVAKYKIAEDDPLDLTNGTWLHHPRLQPLSRCPGRLASDARESWRGAFRFIEEDPDRQLVGLRRPQMGALHAIHAHWTTSRQTATIVMPTGTGKTETMLATLLSAQCDCVLVLVPTDALRTQIAAKFESLGILKLEGNSVLEATARCPVVGTLTSRPQTVSEVEQYFSECNVVVTTSALAGGCSMEVQKKMADLCSHLFIDEAHHAEANTWTKFRGNFENKLVLQFTATPFRQDGKKIDGKFIFVYPLRKAQAEGYFRPIRFRQIEEYNSIIGDLRIAEAAMDELDADVTGKHIVMARVSSKPRADAILELYRSLGRYESVAIHSGIRVREKEEAKAKLFSGAARIVVCVDMLGEGFDLPELKIAAFHDVRKSLAITLQLAGRFTRSRPDLGDPVVIANTALIDVADELRTLYTQDPDWNLLLPLISTSAIDQEVISQEFFQGFGAFLDEVPLKDLRPAASMVVYKTRCANWAPNNIKDGFPGLTDTRYLYHSLNPQENTLVILVASEHDVQWSDVSSIRERSWELLIACWDRERNLLYIHGSGINGVYRGIARVLCGDGVELISTPTVFRCFHGINRLVLNNVGLSEHLGRQVRYTARMGSDVESRIGHAARQGSTKAVLAGQGYENGRKTSAGAAKKGRVWSNLRLRVDTFAFWARAIGVKISDESIDPDTVLEGTLKPESICEVPDEVVVAVDWPHDVFSRIESSTRLLTPGVSEQPITFFDIEFIARDNNGKLILKVHSDELEAQFRLDLLNDEGRFDFEFVKLHGPDLNISFGRTERALAEYFTDYPPVIWFADGSSLEGCEYVKLPDNLLRPFPVERMTAIDWSGVDITKESQRAERLSGTVQHKLIELLQRDQSYQVIFDDDDKGEAADVVAIRVIDEDHRKFLEVDLYHCKFAGGAPGARLDDLYVVCGQAQRSANWLATSNRRTDLFTHLLVRDGKRIAADRSTRFEKGDKHKLSEIRNMSRQMEVKLNVFVVQPGLSIAAAERDHLLLLAVTERYLNDTYEIPFSVYCSA